MADIVLTLEFCHDITIWKMTVYEKVNYIDFEPALASRDLHRNMNGLNINLIEIHVLRHVLAQGDCKTVVLWFTHCFDHSYLENY